MYGLAVGVALPRYLHGLIEREATAVLGRQLSVGALHINPFLFRATVEDLRLGAQQGDQPLLSIARLEVRVAPLESLFRRGVVLSGLRVDQPAVRFSRLAAGRFSFSDIIDRLKARPSAPGPSEPARFALNNIELHDGLIEFDDKPVSLQHRIDNIDIGLPFISSIASHVAVKVKPTIKARLNGTVLALDGEVTPFADHREATLDLNLDPFDVTRYLAYLPDKLPVKVTAAHLATQLKLVWHERPATGAMFTLRGEAALSEVQLTDTAGKDLLGWRRLQVELLDVQPLATPLRVALGKVVWFEPRLALHRRADGSIALPGLSAASSSTTTTTPVARAQSMPAASASKSAASSSGAVQISLASLQVQRGSVSWRDDAVPGGFSSELTPLDLKLEGLNLQKGARPAQLTASVEAATTGELKAQGSVDVNSGAVDVQLALAALQLERYRPYYAEALGAAQPSGGVSAAVRLAWLPGEQGGLRLSQGSFDVANLRVPDLADGSAEAKAKAKPKPKLQTQPTAARPPAIRVAQLHLGEISLDMAKQQFTLGELRSRDASVRVLRDARGINLARLFAAPDKPEVATTQTVATSTSAGAASSATTAKPWQIRTGKADISAWNASIEDRTGREPVSLSLEQLSLQAEGLGPEAMGKLGVAAVVNRKGKLRVDGRLGLSPLRGKLTADLQAIDLLFAQPYVNSVMHVLLTQGVLDARGDLEFSLPPEQKPRISWNGDVAVSGLNLLDEANDADFLRWKRLAATRLSYSTEPASLSLNRLQLDDFYTRLILNDKGQLNLSAMLGQKSPSAEAGAPASEAKPEAKAESRPEAKADMQAPAIKVRLDEVLLSGGQINFSDRFVKPAFDMRVGGLAGSLRGLASDADAVAELDLKGSVDQVAPISIAGKLNPLRRDKVLDIVAKVTDIDLTSTSPYSGRYAGYGISKGKLSMSLDYHLHDGKLTAGNELRLDQLTFGDAVDSPDATSLPVRLAAALLKDRNGVIEVDLPVSGTLDDPEFSIGRVLLRALTNLITKAVRSPFTALSAVFGGGEELSRVEFAAGIAELSPATQTRLEALSKALVERPSLVLDVAGVAETASDTPGLRRAALMGRLRALKAANSARRGEAVGDVDALMIAPAEYLPLLQQLYSESPIQRPKNALGLERKLPQAEMEAMLMAPINIGESELRSLANRRAQAVRDWLLGKGKVPAGRVFLVSSQLAADAVGGGPRVEFSLK
ncbi:DUF748 domain-containing protein [Viridibacterium curvum]|uniref:DUF748 domain-containing protein n=1 Tax=Viridibacterium curvum TaxID=1101404 RepID=A0ABP9QFR0_9RHOO